MRQPWLIVPFALIALAGCSSQPDPAPTAVADATSDAPGDNASIASAASQVSVADAKVQLPAVPGRPAVAYFVLTVGPDAGGSLVGVSVGHFARGEFHQSRMDGGVMTMNAVDRLPLTPGKPIVFAPGGYHVMLFGGDGALKPGDQTTLTLTLDKGPKIVGSAKVVAPGGDMGGMKM